MAAALLLAGAAASAPISAAEIGRPPAADVVILGEVHGNPAHHAAQAAAVAAIAPAALVFEMLTPAQAARATPALRGDPARLAAALEWEASGWPDFALYAPIFAAAPGAVVVGGGLERSEVRRALSEDPARVFGPGAELYGLTDPLPPEMQAAAEAEQQAAHCAVLPAQALPGFVAAQRLRDAALARAALEAHAATGGPVVVITGNGHARTDRGVPFVLSQAAPGLSVLSVGLLEADPGEGAPFDLWLVTAPAPRGDPCAAFRR